MPGIVRDQFVTGGDGSDGSPFTGWQASFQAAQGHVKTFDFPAGSYAHSGILTFNYFHRCQYRTQGVKFVHTGFWRSQPRVNVYDVTGAGSVGMKLQWAVPIHVGKNVWLATNNDPDEDTLNIIGGDIETLASPAYKMVKAGGFDISGLVRIRGGFLPPDGSTVGNVYFHLGGEPFLHLKRGGVWKGVVVA